MTDYDRLNQIQDLLIKQDELADATQKLVDEWLIKLESNITIGDLV